MKEMCYRKLKTVVNPIIDWSEEDVWEFLDTVARVPHCTLYDQGKRRIGCIGCPMVNALEELAEYPKYKALYLRAFSKMLEERKKNGMATTWKTPEEVMDWWVGGKGKQAEILEGQMDMFGYAGEEEEEI